MSQLPSSHLFIHRVPAKLLNRVYALRKKPMPATALIFHLIVTDRASHAPVLIDSVDAIPLQALYGLCADVVLSDSIVYGFLFQNPTQPPILSEVRQGSGINSLYCRLPGLCGCLNDLIHWTFDIPQHLFRIILCSCFQNRIDDPQCLTGYYNQ